MIASGEALRYELVDEFVRRLPRVALNNLYQPTEISVDVTHRICTADDPQRIVLIGRLIANMQTYVLDGRLEPPPMGVTGSGIPYPILHYEASAGVHAPGEGRHADPRVGVVDVAEPAAAVLRPLAHQAVEQEEGRMAERLHLFGLRHSAADLADV